MYTCYIVKIMHWLPPPPYEFTFELGVKEAAGALVVTNFLLAAVQLLCSSARKIDPQWLTPKSEEGFINVLRSRRVL